MPKINGSSLAEHRERTRLALFSALAELLTERSFDRITLSDVAARAGVGRTACYNHVADKEALLLAFIEHETRSYTRALASTLEGIEDPIDRLRVYVRQNAELRRHYHLPPGNRISDAVSHTTAGLLHSHVEIINTLLANTLAEAIKAGLIPHQDVNAAVAFIHATLTCGRSIPTEPEQREAFFAALDSFILRAVGAPASTHPVPAITHPVMDTLTAHTRSTQGSPDLAHCPVVG